MPFGGVSITSWTARRSPNLSYHDRQTSKVTSLDSVPAGFGIPSSDDPDPFGVLALEQAGLEIKEAGTKTRPSSETFEYRPSPTSPIFRQSFQSIDVISMRDRRRDSRRSITSVDQGTQTADLPHLSCDDPRPLTANGASPTQGQKSPELSVSSDSKLPSMKRTVNEDKVQVMGYFRKEYHEIVLSESSPVEERPGVKELLGMNPGVSVEEAATAATTRQEEEASAGLENIRALEVPIADIIPNVNATELAADEDEFLREDTEHILNGAHVAVMTQAAKPTVISKAKLVTIGKRPPPPSLPARNPLRTVRPRSAMGSRLRSDSQDEESSSVYSPSPTRSGFIRDDDITPPSEEASSESITRKQE